MEREADGHHRAEIDAGAGTLYGYSLDGRPTLPDPRSRSQPAGVHGPSAVVTPRRVDAPRRGLDLARAVLYELHVGTFSPEGTFDGAIARLDHLVRLGIDAIELMPVAEFPGERGWGYDGVDLYAPHRAYGGPEGLDRLIAACHARGIAVIVDVVYNHLGPDGNYLERFGPYFTDRHHTPWGKALDYDGPESRPVRDFAIENALMWLRDHGADGIRLDAVQEIVDTSPTHVIAELTARVTELGRDAGRRLWVVAESDLNDPTVLHDRVAGGWGCDAQWNDDLHHALHAALTGERTGYYGDVRGLGDLAKALRDAFVYDGRWSEFRGREHGAPIGDLSGHRFVVYAQTHDQVGNRPHGERLSHLIGEGRLRIAAAVVLLSPYVPMLFMGEEWGARSPFLFFTDHGDPTLGHAVGHGRRREIERFGWRPGDLLDPQSPEAFARSKLDWSEPEREPHRSLLEWHRALIALRREVPELTDGRRDLTDVEVHEEGRWLRMTRGPITLAFAVDRAAIVPLSGDAGQLVLASDPEIRVAAGSLRLPADSVAVLRAR